MLCRNVSQTRQHVEPWRGNVPQLQKSHCILLSVRYGQKVKTGKITSDLLKLSADWKTYSKHHRVPIKTSGEWINWLALGGKWLVQDDKGIVIYWNMAPECVYGFLEAYSCPVKTTKHRQERVLELSSCRWNLSQSSSRHLEPFPRTPIVPAALIFNPVMFALIYISVAFE